MSSPLEGIIIQHIKDNGAMSIGDYMAMALGHPEHGYYMTRDPFGAEGDFTTAPEISQLFGEMIGVWVADVWQQMGAPSEFTLLECGPGRGTLMADILRATRHVPGFGEAAQVFLMEVSPVLKEMQGWRLKDYAPTWIETVDEIPQGKPLIVIGNEFLDALPFLQFQKGVDGWEERIVDVKDGQLCFGTREADGEMLELIPFHIREKSAGSIFEFAPNRIGFLSAVSKVFEKNGGAGLFIDYGHKKAAVGDTFQAVKKHESVDVLSHIGEADLTSHVDFEMLVRGVKVAVHGPVQQGQFLKALGIDLRATALLKHANEGQAQDMQKALYRLTSPGEMGELFKVIGLSSGLKPCGFE